MTLKKKKKNRKKGGGGRTWTQEETEAIRDECRDWANVFRSQRTARTGLTSRAWEAWNRGSLRTPEVHPGVRLLTSGTMRANFCLRIEIRV